MLWYPYCQMKTASNPLHVRGASGVFLYTDTGPLIDSVASWWSVIYGYGRPELVEAIRAQAARLSHCMLGGLVHDPALELAERLAAFCPADLDYVFFSDSGSVAVEVALKMALQAERNGGGRRNRVLALTNAYHGDTFKTMEVGDDPTYHGAFPEKRGVHHVPPISEALQQAFERWGSELYAFILEPMLQGAGGMLTYGADVLFQARRLCDQYDVTLIFDEVATGFGRTGLKLVSDLVAPDILVLGKGLTGGMVGHAATVANGKVYGAFYSDDPTKALMHGPTFMGNPLACAAALAGLELFHQLDVPSSAKRLEKGALRRLSTLKGHPQVVDVRVLGGCACVQTHRPEDLRNYALWAGERGVYARPFGCTLYAMPAYVMNDEQWDRVLSCMVDWFGSPGQDWRKKRI